MVSKDFFFYKILNIHCHIENDMYLAVISTDHRDRLVFFCVGSLTFLRVNIMHLKLDILVSVELLKTL